MTGADRLQILQQIADDTQRPALSLATVSDLDAYLKNDWGMSLAETEQARDALLLNAAGSDWFQVYGKLLDERNKYRRSGQPYPPDWERRWYNHLADERCLPASLSDRRTFILEATAFVHPLVNTLQISGSILDVGCYVGCHAAWLARHATDEVIGIDCSTRAIHCASKKAAGLERVSFEVVDYMRDLPSEGHELAFAADAWGDDSQCFVRLLKVLSHSLVDGGVAVVIGNDGKMCKTVTMRKHAIAQSLGFGMDTWVGGYTGNGYTAGQDPTQFKRAIVFVKGVDSEIPPALNVLTASDGVLEQFLHYAKRGGVPELEQNVAFWRARSQAENRAASGKAGDS